MGKQIIKIKLSEKAVEDILLLEEELGLEMEETREKRRAELSKEQDALFG